MAVFSRNGDDSLSIPMTTSNSAPKNKKQNSLNLTTSTKSNSVVTPLHLKPTAAWNSKRRVEKPDMSSETRSSSSPGIRANGLLPRPQRSPRTLSRQDAIVGNELRNTSKMSRVPPTSTPLSSDLTKLSMERKRPVKVGVLKSPQNKSVRPEVNNNHIQSSAEVLLNPSKKDETPSESFPRTRVQAMIRNFTNKSVADERPLKGNQKKEMSDCSKSVSNPNEVNVIQDKKVDKQCTKEEPLGFVVPLESRVQVVEGSPLELWVKAKGAKRGVWVKKGRGVIPHAPPDLLYKANPVDGSFSLRIPDVFLEDGGLYICELYGDQRDVELCCWCSVEVLPLEEYEESLVEEQLISVSNKKLVVPRIITTSEDEEMEASAAPSGEDHFVRRRSSLEDVLEDISEGCEDAEGQLPPQGDRKLEDLNLNMAPVEEFSPKEEELIVDKKSCDPAPSHGPITPQSSTESVEEGSVASVDGAVSRGSHSSVENTLNFRDDSPLSPKFLMGPSNLIVMCGETIHLRVKIWSPADSVTEIIWAKLTRGVYKQLDECEKLAGNSNCTRIETSQPTADLVMVTIHDVTYEDSGKYRVKISNSHGSDYHHCLVSVEGSPEPPASPPTPQFDELNEHLIICWPCCPFDGGSAILRYILEMKTKSDESWTVITPASFKGLCFTQHRKDLVPGSSYVFRVCVENSHGKGQYSKESPGLLVPFESGSQKPFKRNSHHITKHLSSEMSEYYEYQNVELKHSDFLEYYEKHDKDRLGKGRFGVVFKVTNKATKQNYAGKFVKCRKGSDKERAELEYKIMNELKYHPKLICLVDAFEMPRDFVIVTELINGGELFERVVADDFILTERDCVTFLRQICDGAKYIHDKNVMHLDLKPENILLETKKTNQIKIIDFGLAQYYNPAEPISVLFGTAEFVSPEIINYDTICPATDMWSVGVITYILLSGLSPFLGDDDNETFSNITRGEFDFEDEAFETISEDAKDFISSLILKRKEQRLTAQECLEHKWLALSESEKTDIVLSTVKLKRFLLRRKWQKTGNAIRALGRITTLYSSSRRSSSGTSSTSSIPTTPSLRGDSLLEDSVFTGSDVEPPPLKSGNIISPPKSKYDESCRSDSGIGGEVMLPSSGANEQP